MIDTHATGRTISVLKSGPVLLAAAALLGCPSSEPQTSESVPAAAASAPAPPASQPASHPQTKKDDFPIPVVNPLPPLQGAPAEDDGRWSPRAEPQTCRYRMREVLNETLDGSPLAGYQFVVTYDVTARKVAKGTAYSINVRHIRGRGRRQDYNTKLDSDRAGDLTRVRGGADTTVIFGVVVPFAWLDQTVEVVLAADGALVEVRGADALRKALLDLHPPAPRKSPFYQGRVDTLLDDARIAAFVLPMAGLQVRSEATTERRDDADYAVRLIKNARRRVVGASVLWEEKQAFAPDEEASSVAAKGQGAKIELLRGSRSVSVEEQPDSACFRQAGLKETRNERWTGVLDEDEVTLPLDRVRTRTWVQAELSNTTDH